MKKLIIWLTTTPIGFVASSIAVVLLVVGCAKVLLFLGRDVKVVGTVSEIQQKYQEVQKKQPSGQ